MANQIIILGSNINSVFTTVSLVFWYPITTGALATGGVSAWPKASAAENAAIQAGTILEEQQSFQFPTGLTAAQMETYLLQYWTNRNAQLNGQGPGMFQNVGYNGTAWVANIT
jgi:hypothetical protein